MKGAIPSTRSSRCESIGFHELILGRGSPAATRCARVQLPLGSPNTAPLRRIFVAAIMGDVQQRVRSGPQPDYDGLVTLGSLIRSPYCVRFAGNPRGSERRGSSRDDTCMTSRVR